MSEAGPPVLPVHPPAAFEFSGNARDFFRIWIVNTLLTVLTLGLFAAWAKVRRRRYLRGHTALLGSHFDYTADPRRLLVGNLVVAGLFLAYAVFGAVYPVIRFGAVLVFLACLPWIVVRSLSFNAHNTVYRGLRFRFHPSLSSAVMVYLLQPMLIIVTLGLYFPAWERRRQEFSIGRHRLGTAYFQLKLKSGRFYAIYFAAGGLLLLASIAIGIVYAVWLKPANGHVPSTAQLIPAVLIYGATAFVVRNMIFAEVFNSVWNATRLDTHTFRSSLESSRWIGLQTGNLLAIIATCGLAYPWAVIRSTRYVLSKIEFRPAEPLESIAALGRSDGSAVGDTAAEFAGLDFGL